VRLPLSDQLRARRSNHPSPSSSTSGWPRPYTPSTTASCAFPRPTSSRTLPTRRSRGRPRRSLLRLARSRPAGITSAANPRSPRSMSRRKTAPATDPARRALPPRPQRQRSHHKSTEWCRPRSPPLYLRHDLGTNVAGLRAAHHQQDRPNRSGSPV